MYRNSENDNLLYPELSINTEPSAPQLTEYGTSRASSSRSRSDSNLERELLLSARKSGRYSLKPSYKKKRSRKICCICCLICCCILVIPASIIGILVGIAKIECNKTDAVVALDHSFAFNTFDSIHVKNVMGNLDLGSSNNASQADDTIRVVVSRKSPKFKLTKGTEATVQLIETTLDVDVQFSLLYFFGCPSTHVRLELPPSVKFLPLSKIKTDVKYGDIKLEKIKDTIAKLDTKDGSITMTSAKNISSSSFHTISGNINITDTSFTPGESSSFNTVNGDMLLHNTSSFKPQSSPFTLDMKTKKGNIDATQFKDGSIKSNTVFGHISIDANDEFAGTVDAESQTGTTSVKGENVTRSKDSKHVTKATVNGGGKQSIKASTKSGDIKVSFKDNK